MKLICYICNERILVSDGERSCGVDCIEKEYKYYHLDCFILANKDKEIDFKNL